MSKISEKIIEKVREKERESSNFNRCLNVLVCPECGEDLESKDIGGENLIEIEYTCNKCSFTHTRLES